MHNTQKQKPLRERTLGYLYAILDVALLLLWWTGFVILSQYLTTYA